MGMGRGRAYSCPPQVPWCSHCAAALLQFVDGQYVACLACATELRMRPSREDRARWRRESEEARHIKRMLRPAGRRWEPTWTEPSIHAW